MRLTALVLLTAVAVGTVPVRAADGSTDPQEGRAVPPEDTAIEMAEAAATVSGALQGQDGLRIQTLCTHCNSANIQVGGMAAELVPISINGYPVFGGLATSMIFSILPADTVANADVSKGPGKAVSPAAAAGGVINLTESTPQELPRIDFVGEIGSFDRARGTARVAGPLASWVSGALVVGTETADTVDADADGVNDVPAVDRTFAEARMEFEAGRNHTLDAGFSYIDEENTDGRGAYDFLDLLANANPDATWTREDALLDRREYRGGWKMKLGQGRSLAVRFLADNRHQVLRSQLSRDPDVIGGAFGDATDLKDRIAVDETNEWGSAQYRHPIGTTGMIVAGIEAQAREVSAASFDWTGLGEPETAVDSVDTGSAFVGFDYKLWPKTDVQIGLRYTHAKWGGPIEQILGGGFTNGSHYRERNRTLPRVTVLVRPAKGWTLRFVGGTSFRVPSPIFSEICCGAKYQRNINTAAETGVTVGFEGIFQPSPDLRVSVYTARTRFEDHILRLVGWSEYYVQTYAMGNVPETQADTAEFVMRWSPARRVTLDGSITWLSHHNEGEQDVEVFITRFDPMNPEIVLVPMDRIPYQPLRTGSIAATISLPGQAQITGQASYSGSMLIQQWEADDFLTNHLLPEMRSTPSFWLVNLAFRVPAGNGLELFAGVDNITDEVQDDLSDRTTDFNWGPLAGRSWRAGLRYSR